MADWFTQNAPTGISNPNPTTIPNEQGGVTKPWILAGYPDYMSWAKAGYANAGFNPGGISGGGIPTPPTGGINPGGMYSGGISAQVQDPWGRSPGDPDYGRNPAGSPKFGPYTGAPVPGYGPAPALPNAGYGPAPTTATGGAPPGGYTQAWFVQNFGEPKTPAELVALEPQLAQYGIKVARNASGIAGDIQLPSGQYIDVIGGASTGGGSFHWNPDMPGGTGGAGQWGNQAPYAGMFTGGGQYPLASVMGTGLMAPWTTPFTAPTDVTQQNDPGWQFRMKEGLKAIERSAASKGTLLTGGTLKDLNSWAQDTASNEYDKVYNRALREYQQAYGIFGNNQANQFGRLNALSQSGLTAAGNVNANNSGYAQGASDLYTQQGNANAAGTVGSANAWNSALGNIGNTAGNLAYWYATRPPSTANPSGYADPRVTNTYEPWKNGQYYPGG